MATEWVDFKQIKQKISMEMVLSHYQLLKTFRRSSHGLRGPCPIHKGKHNNQFHVDTVKNRWNCFGGCDMKELEGHVIGFVAAMENVSLRDAAIMIAKWYDISTAYPARKEAGEAREREAEKAPQTVTTKDPEKEELPKAKAETKPAPCATTPELSGEEDLENKELTFELKNLSTTHPFFNERGITSESIAHFGLGHCGKGIMKDRIVFPIHRHDGKLIAYTGRTVNEITDENPKWLLPPGLIKTKVLFNFHRVAGKFSSVILVEGPLDLLAVHQAGFPNVVALLGKEVLEVEKHSYDQLRLITENFNHAILLLDGDEDGREGAATCAIKLSSRMFVRIVSLLDGKDPADLTAPELAEILSFSK